MVLSIIIPVYNVQNTLKRCILSVAGQYEDKVELILVDDGSTDHSPNICDSYAKHNIKVIHQKNGGLSAARNTGIQHSTGMYMFFLDSDDMVVPEFLSEVIPVLEGEQPDILSFRFCTEKKLNQFNPTGTKRFTEHKKIWFYNQILTNQLGSQVCFHIYKKNLFNEISFPLDCHYEDIRVFWKLISKAEKFIDVDYSYYIYNLTNPSSITKNTSVKSMTDMKTAIDEMIDGIKAELQKVGLLTEREVKFAEYARLNGYVYIAWKIRNNSQDSCLLKDELKNYIRNASVNLFQYQKYNWKKYIVCKGLIILSLF